MSERSSHIGTLSEKSLHAQLKEWYARAGDEFEVCVEGFVIDIRRGNELIEIQTGNFAKIKRKLLDLVRLHPVRLVYPIAREKWIIRQSPEGECIGKRRSPKHGQILDMFAELVYIPGCLNDPHFSVEVLLTQEEEIRRRDGHGSWRRGGWSIYDRKLIKVCEVHRFENAHDYLQILPITLPDLYTNRDLSELMNCRIGQAQKITYTFRHAGFIQYHGKRGKANLYTHHQLVKQADNNGRS